MNRCALCSLALLAALSLTACVSAGGSPPPPLLGTTWQHGADGPQAAHLLLDDKAQRLVGFGGCNRLTGRYTLSGSALSFDGVASTRRACLDEDGSEDRFLAALAGVRGWRIEGGQLKLLSASGGTLLELRPAPANVPAPR